MCAIIARKHANIAEHCLALQTSAARAVPVLPNHTAPGNVILSSKASSGLSCPVHWDSELEKLSLAHLGAACREALAAVVGPGGGQGSAQHALEEEHVISPEGSHGSFDSNVDSTVGEYLAVPTNCMLTWSLR